MTYSAYDFFSKLKTPDSSMGGELSNLVSSCKLFKLFISDVPMQTLGKCDWILVEWYHRIPRSSSIILYDCPGLCRDSRTPQKTLSPLLSLVFFPKGPCCARHLCGASAGGSHLREHPAAGVLRIFFSSILLLLGVFLLILLLFSPCCFISRRFNTDFIAQELFIFVQTAQWSA